MEINYSNILTYFGCPVYSIGLCIAIAELFLLDKINKQRLLYFLSDIFCIAAETTIFFILGVYFFSVQNFNLQLFKIEGGPLALLVAILLYDLFFFCEHYLMHKLKFLWPFHFVHHSLQRYALSLGFRLSWFRPVRRLLFFYPLFILGFDPVVLLLAMAVINAYGFFVHSAFKFKFIRPFNFFVSPHIHSIHHEIKNTSGVNLGGLTTLWDRIFGTFLESARPNAVYGVPGYVFTLNPFKNQFCEPLRYFQIVQIFGKLKNRLKKSE